MESYEQRRKIRLFKNGRYTMTMTNYKETIADGKRIIWGTHTHTGFLCYNTYTPATLHRSGKMFWFTNHASSQWNIFMSGYRITQYRPSDGRMVLFDTLTGATVESEGASDYLIPSQQRIK